MTSWQTKATTSAGDPPLVVRYEELRQQALRTAGDVSRGSGLALFVRQGMKSWMEAWSRCTAAVSTKGQINTGLEEVFSTPPSREVVMILASMALANRQEAKR